MHLNIMPNIIIPPGWRIPEKLVTPEKVFFNRRRFLRQMGLAGGTIFAAGLVGCDKPSTSAAAGETKTPGSTNRPPAGRDPNATFSTKGYPAKRNPDFNPGLPLTSEHTAANYNNFYEFSTSKERVATSVGKFVVTPWVLEIGGLVEKPLSLDAQELIDMMPLEERVYRFRCVEAWSMVVPWTGFPLSKLIEKVTPKSSAKFLKFTTFNRPEQAPGMARNTDYPWPYTEGLRLDEAMNPLAMVVTGIYGKPLPKQHGAPLRIIVPWKYGYKSAKSVVKIEFTDTQPSTFWETLSPTEYPFESNVNPKIAHPRWSQAMERVIDTGDLVPTSAYNGYGEYVSKLYKS